MPNVILGWNGTVAKSIEQLAVYTPELAKRLFIEDIAQCFPEIRSLPDDSDAINKMNEEERRILEETRKKAEEERQKKIQLVESVFPNMANDWFALKYIMGVHNKEDVLFTGVINSVIDLKAKFPVKHPERSSEDLRIGVVSKYSNAAIKGMRKQFPDLAAFDFMYGSPTETIGNIAETIRRYTHDEGQAWIFFSNKTRELAYAKTNLNVPHVVLTTYDHFAKGENGVHIPGLLEAKDPKDIADIVTMLLQSRTHEVYGTDAEPGKYRAIGH